MAGLRVLLLILAFLFSVIGFSYSKEPIKIGAILSVTGPASFIGEQEKNTLLLLAEEVNKAGGINGRPLEVIIEDSKSGESQAVLSAKKLIERDKVVAILGPSTTGESMAVIPIISQAKIPLISLAAGTGITEPVNERYWVFKTAQYDRSAVEAIYRYMQKKGIQKVGILTITNSFGDQGRKALLELAPKFGIQVVADERYKPEDSDMTVQLLKAHKAGAQAIINWSVGPTQVIVVKNWQALKLNIPLFQSHGWGSKKNIQLAGSAAEGVIAPLGRIVVWDKLPEKHPQKKILEGFVRAYEAKYKTEPGTFAGHAYDAFMMVVEAMKKVGPDSAKIRDYIEHKIKNWPGISGVFNISPKDHCGLDASSFEMVVVKKGDWEIIQ
ncbi:ABC transporter substrate-binding protein [Caldimicrobium thiodismutans]|jgi:branched-chain amino acid transport system substrate-binding protein|uniref:ABC transporter substrate-binding protein n=1 Tax=Caldimicrobium thiodismutans TaxID=1653476 RepID=A0A0U4W404_9BACT|nr:ABC transporter substrate-binding protein [Caldimicrobium thiodismutans]BAU23834.1 ABC transporter substrate-binding protein [Caldimicrobium thiodismutans]